MTGLYDALVASGCGVLGSFLIVTLHRKMTRREEAESNALATLNERRITNLENDMKRHGEMLVAVNTMAVSVQDISKDIKEMIATNAAQSQALTNLSSFVTNLREDIGEVRRDLKEHQKEKHNS